MLCYVMGHAACRFSFYFSWVWGDAVAVGTRRGTMRRENIPDANQAWHCVEMRIFDLGVLKVHIFGSYVTLVERILISPADVVSRS